MLAQLKPWQISSVVHFAFIALFFSLTQMNSSITEKIEVPLVVTVPIEAQKLIEVKERPKVVLKSINEPLPKQAPSREVFGANRNSYTDNNVNDAEAVAAKKGNTLAKESDKEVLNASDADSLPTPTEEYLVSEMPSVLSEVRPNYPKEAKEKELEGSVAMDVLIDGSGKVRQVSVIEGPEIFRQGAIEAMKKFLFRPAKVDGKPVAVRIRYSLKFQLEY